MDKGSARIEQLEKEVEQIKIKLAEKVSREEFNKLIRIAPGTGRR